MCTSSTSSTRRMLIGYTLAVLLIPLYVNMFSVWKILNSILPQIVMFLLPICITLLLLGTTLLYFSRSQARSESSISMLPLFAGVLVCVSALTVPDPNFPVKRIHVAEYMSLSLLVRYAMSPKLSGPALFFFSAVLTCLLGIHDEFLQGLHPSRTYGLRDMSVNALGSCGGALIWHGLGLFSLQNGRAEKERTITVSFTYLFCLAVSTLALVLPLMAYKGFSLPLWPAVPLFATMVYFCSYREEFTSTWQHGILAVSIGAFCLGIYPFIPEFLPYSFF